MFLTLQVVANGLIVGCVYALIALGFMLIYNVIDMLNFSQGDMVMVGAFIGFTLSSILPFPLYLSWPIGICAGGLLGAFIARLIIYPLRRAGALELLIIAIGLSIVLKDLSRIIWGAEPIAATSHFGSSVFNLGGLIFNNLQIGMLCITVACMVAIMVFLKTKLGVAIRATAANPDIAGLMGINTGMIIIFTFALSMALSTVAGMLISSQSYLVYTMGSHIVLKAFIGAVIGGFGSIPGAVIGGLVVGLSEGLSSYFISTEYTGAIIFAILILVLLFRPTGLMGRRGYLESL